MPTRKMWVSWDPGANLSQSRKKPGDFSPLTRDGDNNLGHVTLRDVDENEENLQANPETVFVYVADEQSDADDSSEQALVALAVLAVILAADRAAPHLKRWWQSRSLHLLKSARARISMIRASGRPVLLAGDPSTASGGDSAQASSDVVSTLATYKASMSSAEARERFIAALVARLFSEEQLRTLRNARIADDGGALHLASAMETLTPKQLEESIAKMLETNPSWPDEETVAELSRALRHKSGCDGDDVLLRRQQPPQVSRRPGGEK